MNNYSISKKIIVGILILICSHSLMSCSNFILDKNEWPTPVVYPSEYKQRSSKVTLLDQQKALQQAQFKHSHTSQQAVVRTIEEKLVGQTLTLKTGQEVRFYQESGILKAGVDEKRGSLSRSLKLPVYVGQLDPDQVIQARHIYLVTPEKDATLKGVYISQPGLLGGMWEPEEEEDHNMPFVDPDVKGFSSDSEDDGAGQPSKEVPNTSKETPTTEDPSNVTDGYQEALEIERQMKERLKEVARQKGIRLLQVNLIEKHLAEIKKAGKISKEELNKIKKEVQQKIDFVLNWKPRPTDTIKCEECKRQMRVDRNMLFHMDNDVFGKGTWHLCDEYGNRKPGTPDYPNLAAIIAAHDSRTHFVHTCVYCYREKDIARTEKEYERSKQKYEELRQDYQQAARRTNRSARKEQSIKKKMGRQEKSIASYKVAIEALKEAAQAMEKLRKEAIVDYESITYGAEKYSKRYGV